MSTVTPHHPKFALAPAMIVGLTLIVSACAPHPKSPPTWGGALPTPQNTGPTVYRPAGPLTGADTAENGMSNSGRRTFTQGCTGSFTVRDARTNRQISTGRAFNSGTGLIALDARGRQTRVIATATNLSVTFLPDCNCRSGGNQSSATPDNQQFAANVQNTGSCNTN